MVLSTPPLRAKSDGYFIYVSNPVDDTIDAFPLLVDPPRPLRSKVFSIGVPVDPSGLAHDQNIILKPKAYCALLSNLTAQDSTCQARLHLFL